MLTLTIILYVISVSLFALYIFRKAKHHRPLLSPFAISLYQYVFSLFLMPFVFYYSDKSWLALGIKSAASMHSYLLTCLSLNLFGFILMMIVQMAIEFRTTREALLKRVEYQGDFVYEPMYIMICSFALLGFYYIVFKYNGGLPLFNGGRTFFYGTSISPIYQFLCKIITFNAIYFGTKVLKKKTRKLSYFVLFLLCSFTMLTTGTRSAILMNIVLPLCVFYYYLSATEAKRKGKSTRRLLTRLLVAIFAIAASGLALQAIRSGGNINMGEAIEEILYGNTFSDIRDGAFILYGFEKKGGEFVLGKTYAAGIISFIPSSMSPFRVEWSFGRYTTKYLFGMDNHFGLRGGNVMEGYLNFGIIGVLLVSIMQGYFNALCEKWFYSFFKKPNGRKLEVEYLLITVFGLLGSLFTCTSGFYNFYVGIIYLAAIYFSSKIFGVKGASPLITANAKYIYFTQSYISKTKR